MEKLLTYLRQVTEEGDNVDAYSEILPSDAALPVRDLVVTHQDAQRSRLGDYYEIHGRVGFIVLLRGGLDILLQGIPLHLRSGQAFLHLAYQTHFFLRETADALICAITFESDREAPWNDLSGRVFNMPAQWIARHETILQHWLAGCGDEAARALHSQLLACAAGAAAEPQTATPPWLAPLQELLATPANTALRVKELADRLGLSPNYLNSAFRELYGAPLGSYLEHRRFGTAVSLLASPTHSIAHVAAETGFLTNSAFCRKIKTWSGLTPGQCRRILISPAPQIRFTPFGQTIVRNV